MKDNINETPLEMGLDVKKIHGHMTIILKDSKTGEETVIEDDNMMTDALKEYFANCGFLNYPNVNQSNMVEELLGGLMGFDTALTEDEDVIHVPAGAEMIFNGSVGVTNTGNTPSELGTCSTATVGGEPDTGWQSDGSYKITIDFAEQQGNCKTGKPIRCVCLTGKAYGHAGEGNATSNSRLASGNPNITGLGGTVTAYSGIPGYIFNISFGTSTVQSLSFEEVEEEEGGETVTVTKGFLRTYRLPISAINLKGTTVAPVLLDETEITIPAHMEPYLTAVNGGSVSGYWLPLYWQNKGADLLLWNANLTYGQNWGTDFTQYLWTVTPSGTVTETTITNTSGVSLQGLGGAWFDGNYAFFLNYAEDSYPYKGYLSNQNIYVLNRTTGAISIIANSNGTTYSTSSIYQANIHVNQRDLAGWVGWYLLHGSGDGKIVTTGNYPTAVDAVNSTAYPTNAGSTSLGGLMPVAKLIRHNGLNLYREQGYIATINNLADPVTKDSSKTMKVVYKISFEEES